MSIGVTFPSAGGQSGIGYTVPEPGDVMTQSLTDYLVAMASKGLAVPASADLDLGAAFGIKSIYFKTRTANPAASGVLRLANADSLAFRNAANSADLALAVDSGNNLLFGGANVTGNPMLDASTAAGQSIPNTTTTIVVFGTAITDSDGGLNIGTGRYTVPAGKGGDYEISASVAWNASPGAAPKLAIFVGAVETKTAVGNGSVAGASSSIAATVRLAAGAIVDIRATQASGGAVVLTSSAVQNYFTLKRVPT